MVKRQYAGIVSMDKTQLINKKIRDISSLDGGISDLANLTSIQRARLMSWMESENINTDILNNSTLDTKSNDYVKNNSEVINHPINSQFCFIGTDIQSIDELFLNISGDIKSNSEFTNIFDETEIVYAESKRNTQETLAGIFAAKEAILKTGLYKNYQNLNEIVITHNEDGMPLFQNFSLSISHSNNIAMAVAISVPEANSYDSYSNTNSNEEIVKNKPKIRPLSLLITFVFSLVLIAIFSYMYLI